VLLGVIMQQIVVISYRRFGTTYRSHEMSEIRNFMLYSDLKNLLLSNTLIQELIIRLQY